jgi:hypothetical protein
MTTTYRRRQVLATFGATMAASLAASIPQGVTRYVRFQRGSHMAYGTLEGDIIREIRGDLFGEPKDTGTTHKLSELKLLYPCRPEKVPWPWD